jgi:hypothetical protein
MEDIAMLVFYLPMIIFEAMLEASGTRFTTFKARNP